MSIMYRSQQSEVVKIVTGPAMYRQDSKTKTTKRKATQTPLPPKKPHNKTKTTQKNNAKQKRKHGKTKGNTKKHNTNQTNKKLIKPQNKSKTNHKSNRNKATKETRGNDFSGQLLHNSYTSMWGIP